MGNGTRGKNVALIVETILNESALDHISAVKHFKSQGNKTLFMWDHAAMPFFRNTERNTSGHGNPQNFKYQDT